jgi:hypothetical protein
MSLRSQENSRPRYTTIALGDGTWGIWDDHVGYTTHHVFANRIDAEAAIPGLYWVRVR